MASEIKVDSIVNSSGDEDSGFDLSTNDVVKVKTANNERMRIDSSGHVLVGKTTTAVNTQGIQLGSNGRFFATSDGAETGVFNRKTSNGTIIDLRKDNTTMGSIGTGSSRICIGNGDTFLTVAEDLDALYPASSSETTPRDNAVDLGTSGTRFNNLYLSGGVFVGGTGPGNKLDDYEEGTWTPVMNQGGSTLGIIADSAIYTKIGRFVHIQVYATSLASTTSSGFRISGLPFTNLSYGQTVGSIMYQNIDIPGSRTQLVAYAPSSSNIIRLYAVGDNTSWQEITGTNTGTSFNMIINLQYTTS